MTMDAQNAARVRLAVTTCLHELRELATFGLALDQEQTDEVRQALATVAPSKASK